MSTVKANTIEAATTNGDLTLQGNGTGVVNLAAGAKLNGVAFGSLATASSAGKVLQYAFSSGTLSTSTTGTGTGAAQIISQSFTPTSNDSTILLMVTGGVAFGSNATQESLFYITWDDGTEVQIFQSSTLGNESNSSRPKLGTAGTASKTTPGTSPVTIRVRVNGKTTTGGSVTADWALQLTVLEMV